MKKAKKYLITLFIGLLITFLVVNSRGIFVEEKLYNIYGALFDGFFVSGISITCAGLLMFISNEGMFDMMVFGVKSFANMFRRRENQSRMTYYEYKEARAESKLEFGFLLICGLILLAISFIFMFLYLRAV